MAHSAEDSALAAEMPFPAAGTLPKNETNALSFLSDHPEYDGRGVTIAVADTGVDPGAAGLQTTSDGRPKVIDLVECTGSGDVDMSTVRKAEAGATSIDGLCGRTLKLNADWSNPTGQWRVGRKAAFELAASGLVKRWKKTRAKNADKVRNQEIARLAKVVQDLTAAKAKKSAIASAEAAVAALKNRVLGDDLGPVYDCVVFHDGEKWCAAIDSTETGDFSDKEAFTNFRVARQYGTITEDDAMLNYALNIYDEGATLSIVTDAGAHGTHVACIAAAFHPDNTAINGVAPGAQVVGVKIGDTRLGSMETNVGLARAMRAIVENKCDLVNMSYGEPSALPNAGRFVDLVRELVYEKGVIFISSAGNAGPCLSTVGAPGGTSTAIIGVGALVSPLMARAEYSLCNTSPKQNYTWSSRGPTYDGALGVCISAPGGAITSVPNWTLRRSMLMNGTSMSSPNACGNVALILSGLKAEGLAYRPHTIRRALENSSMPLVGTGVFGLGHGLLQVDAAYKLAAAYAVAPPRPQLVVSTTVNGVQGRGVYLRNAAETSAPTDVGVSISPKFSEHEAAAVKLAFDMRITLLTTATWVTAPAHMDLNGYRFFTMNVDPTQLQAGAHYAEVRGYDADNTEGGPVFRIPITVVRPLPERGAEPFVFNELHFNPGDVHRMFFTIPEGATWVDVHVRRLVDAGDDDDAEAADASSRLMVLHMLQVVDQTNQKQTNKEHYIRMRPAQQNVFSMAVVPDRTLEVAVAEYWSMQSTCCVSLSVQFRGAAPQDRTLFMHGATGIVRSDVRAILEDVTVSPAAKLTHHAQVVAPKSAVVRPAKARDATPLDRPVFDLELSYAVTQASKGKLELAVAGVHGLLYSSPFGGALVIVSDKNNRLVGTSDAFPETLELPAGTYTVRVQVKHDRIELLERMKTLPLTVKRKLSSDISLKAYKTLAGAATGEQALRQQLVVRGTSLPVFFAADPKLKLPKGVKPGEVLTGTVTYCKASSSVAGPDKHPDGFPIHYLVAPSAPSAPKSPSPPDGKTDEEKLASAIRDLRVKQLAGVKDDAVFDAMYAELKEHADAGHLPTLQAKLKRVDAKWEESANAATAAAADAVIAAVDVDAVVKTLAARVAADDSEAKAAKAKATSAKAALIDALYRKARSQAGFLGIRSNAGKSSGTAAADSAATDADADQPAAGAGAGAGAGSDASTSATTQQEAFTATAKELAKWTDLGKTHPLIAIEQHIVAEEYGSALAAINAALKQGQESATKIMSLRKWFALRAAVWEALGVESEADSDKRAVVARFAPALPPIS